MISSSVKMITDREERDQFPININNKRATSSSSSSRLWSAGLKDPRIVRVSRLGGKDRHSKVSTIRGLRDRRVRLSVPTAIQLYDLQDRLGLNQPSKVVDWLLNAAQHEIDKLPPLENFINHFHQSLDDQEASKANSYINIHDHCFDVNEGDHQHQIEIARRSPELIMSHEDVGIYNSVQSASFHHHQADHNLLQSNNSRGGGGGGGDQALGLISNINNGSGFPNNYASNYNYHWPDQPNRTFNFSQLGIISSQVDAAHPASMFSSTSYVTSTAPCNFELDGSSAQQNPANTILFRNSFHSGSPKARPF